MRWMCLFAALLAACVLTDAAVGFQPVGPAGGCSSCNGSYGTIAAPACCFPGFGMVPGCCESRPTCCDHVWDTYCQGKAYRLQRHYMRQAMRPPLMPYEQPYWGGANGMMQPVPEMWGIEAPDPPVPLPDPTSEAAP